MALRHNLSVKILSTWCLRPSIETRASLFMRSHDGPDFIASEVQAWLTEGGTASHYIDPGYPWQSGFTESFHSEPRDELLDRVMFAFVA